MDRDLEEIMQGLRDGGCNDQTQKEILMRIVLILQELRNYQNG